MCVNQLSDLRVWMILGLLTKLETVDEHQKFPSISFQWKTKSASDVDFATNKEKYFFINFLVY